MSTYMHVNGVWNAHKGVGGLHRSVRVGATLDPMGESSTIGSVCRTPPVAHEPTFARLLCDYAIIITGRDFAARI
jgi:hypothetical protein